MFPTGVGVWFAALFSLSSLAIRGSLLEALIVLTHIDYLIPAATPPLGGVPRALMALAIAGLGFHIGRKLGRKIAQSEAEASASANWAAASAAYGAPSYHEQAYHEPAPFVSAHSEHGAYAEAPYAEAAYAETGARRPFQVHEEVGGDYPAQPASPYPAEPIAWGQEAAGQYPAGISPAQPEYHAQGEYAAQGFYQPAYPGDYPAQHQPQYQPDHQAPYQPPYQPPYAAMPEAQPPVAPEYHPPEYHPPEYNPGAYHPGYAESPPAWNGDGNWPGNWQAEASPAYPPAGQHAAPYPPQAWPQPAWPGEQFAQPGAQVPEYAPAYAPAPQLTPEPAAAPAQPPLTPAPLSQTPGAPQDAVSWLHSSDAFSHTEAATEAFFASPSEATIAAEDHNPAGPSAAERLTGDALDKLSPLELVERLAMAMQRHEASEPPAPAPVSAPEPTRLTDSFPFSGLAPQPAAAISPVVGGESAAPARSALAALRGLK